MNTAPTILDRKIPPVGKSLYTFKLREIEKWDTASGPEIYYFEDNQQSAVRIEWLFDVGAMDEIIPGVRNMACKMFKEGTHRYSSIELAEVLDGYGAYLEPLITADKCGLSLYALDKYLPQLMPLFKNLIIDSVFPERELEIQKESLLQELRVNKEKTSFLSKEKYRQLLFGENHPYAHSITEAEVSAIRREDLVKFRDNILLPSASYMIITGNIGAMGTEKIMSLFSDLPSGRRISSSYPPSSSDSAVAHVAKPDAKQASLKIGFHIPDRRHPDHFALLFLNKILGGYFGSRLMQNLREEKGYTYGIHSSLTFLKHASYLTINADVVKEHLDIAVSEINKEIKKLCTEEVGPAELHSVRQYMLGTFLSSLSNSFSVADKFKTLHEAGLSYEYYTKWIDAVKTMDPATLKKTASAYLDNNHTVTVTCA